MKIAAWPMLAGLFPAVLMTAVTPMAAAQAKPQPTTAQEWVKAAVDNQLNLVGGDAQYMRYIEHRHDASKDPARDQTRDVVETREGFVSRVIEQNGQPLSAEQNNLELQHLNKLLTDPSDLEHHHKREQSDLALTKTLIAQLPTAMVWTMVPSESNAETVVLDYAPNPEYHPPSAYCVVLKSLTGRLWIDARTRTMTRIEATLAHDADYGWGLGYHLNGGGTIMLEQHAIDPDNSGHPHWEETRFAMHVTGTFLVFKHFNGNVTESHDHFSRIAGAPSYTDGVKMLLNASGK